jgi:hypothetical protein
MTMNNFISYREGRNLSKRPLMVMWARLVAAQAKEAAVMGRDHEPRDIGPKSNWSGLTQLQGRWSS